MLMLEAVLPNTNPQRASDSLTLSFELRRRARLRATLDSGREVGLLLERGLSLKDGDRLSSSDGALVVAVHARAELLSTVQTPDRHLLARAAYHLGNRHVPLQIEPGKLAYQHDHVLDGLMHELGLEVRVVQGPFEPEAGGYAGGHRHGDGHQHAHDELEHHHHHEDADAHGHDQGRGREHDSQHAHDSQHEHDSQHDHELGGEA